MHWQRTLKSEIHCHSVGLHTGRKVSMTILPAEADQGVVFVRRDLPGKPRIKADVYGVTDTTLATTLGADGVTVSTVEHLMSAFAGMGVDNAVVELDSFEVPIMDGSARPFVDMLKDVGTKNQGVAKPMLVVLDAVSVEDKTGSATLTPAPSFRMSYILDFKHPLIGWQTYDFEFSDVAYERDICYARTFGFLKDVEYLQAAGLALGGSLDNAIVLDDARILNKAGLRCPQEFVKHKVLDAVGDLSLLGMPIIGHFEGHKSGHRLNNLLLRTLLERKEVWTLTTVYDREAAAASPRPLHLPAFGVLDAAAAQA